MKCNDEEHEMYMNEDGMGQEFGKPISYKQMSQSLLNTTFSINQLCSDGFLLDMGLPLSQQFLVNFNTNMTVKSPNTQQESLMNPKSFLNIGLQYANKYKYGIMQMHINYKYDNGNNKFIIFKNNYGYDFKIQNESMKMMGQELSFTDISVGKESKLSNMEISINNQQGLGFSYVQRIKKLDIGVEYSYSQQFRKILTGVTAKYNLNNKNLFFNYEPNQEKKLIGCSCKLDKKTSMGSYLDLSKNGNRASFFYSKAFERSTIKGIVNSDFSIKSLIVIGSMMNPLKLILSSSHKLGNEDYKFGFGLKVGATQ